MEESAISCQRSRCARSLRVCVVACCVCVVLAPRAHLRRVVRTTVPVLVVCSGDCTLSALLILSPFDSVCSTMRRRARDDCEIARRDADASNAATAADSSFLAAPAVSTPFNSPVFRPEAYEASNVQAAAAAQAQAAAHAAVAGLSRSVAPHASTAAATSSQQAQIRHLQSQLLASQHAHAQATAQLVQAQQQQQAQQSQALQFATPAAWARHRKFLLDQPTPKAFGDIALPPGTEAPEPLLAAAAAAAAATARRSAPSSASGSAARPSQSMLTHQRSFSSTSGSAHGDSESNPGSLTPSPSLGPQSSASSAAAAAAAASSKLAHVQASLRHLKHLQVSYEESKATALQKSRIQKTFLALSSFLIILCVAILVYYDYLILAPHLHSLFWAFLFSLLLDAPQRALLRGFAWLDARVLDHYAQRLEVGGLVVTLFAGLFFSTQLSVLFLLGVGFLLWTFLLFGDRNTLTAVILLSSLLLLLAFPLFFLAKTCVDESTEIASRLRQFIEGNAEFQSILEDFSTSSSFLWLQSYVRSWGYEIPVVHVAKLREMILSSLVQFADQLTGVLSSVYGMLSNLGSMLISLVTFASMLYFLLASRKDWKGVLTWLSPFSADDNQKLIHTIKKSVLRIFVCSFCVGALHVVVTYVSFSLCGIDLCLILSFLSGFAAMLPIFSSWIVWMPACGGLLIAGRHVSATLLCAVQITLLFYVDPLIMSNIPGDSYVIGMSIVMAVYAFGSSGVLIGPLLAGLTFTFLSIYQEYLSMPLFQHNPTSNNNATIAGAPQQNAAHTQQQQQQQQILAQHQLAQSALVNGDAALLHSAATASSIDAPPHFMLHDSSAFMAPLDQFGRPTAGLHMRSAHQRHDSHDSDVGEEEEHRSESPDAQHLANQSFLAAPTAANSAIRSNSRGTSAAVTAASAHDLQSSPLASNPSRTLRFATPLQGSPASDDFAAAATNLPPSGRKVLAPRQTPQQSPPLSSSPPDAIEEESGEEMISPLLGASSPPVVPPQQLSRRNSRTTSGSNQSTPRRSSLLLNASLPAPHSPELISPLSLASPNALSLLAGSSSSSSPLISPASGAGSLGLDPSPSPGPVDVALRLQAAHVEATHSRLIQSLEAEIEQLQRESSQAEAGAAEQQQIEAASDALPAAITTKQRRGSKKQPVDR